MLLVCNIYMRTSPKKRVKVYPKKISRKQKKQEIKNSTVFPLIALFIILFLALIFAGRIPVRIPFFPNTGGINLALHDVAHSSSYLNTTSSATQAVDGDQNTVWESNHTLPASITVYLNQPSIINQIVLKLPLLWGAKTETVQILGSSDNVNFTQIVAPTSYSISPTATIAINPVIYQYIRVVISSNSQTDSAQLSELEVYGTPPRTPWAIQSVDVMKYSKDVVCNPPTAATINTMTDRIASTGANFVAISTPYDDPSCGSSMNLTNAWVASARAKKLHVWFRHMGLSFEGLYGVSKTKDLAAYTQQIVNYIYANPDQFQDGDIFTPTPEPDSAGIYGVTYCPTICQFSSADEYNSWIQTTQAEVKAAFAKLNKNVKVGYYGQSGFIVWGENNPDWTGKGFLTQATVDSMDGVIAMDTYPEVFGGNMASSLDGAHARWPNAQLVIGEWGTITATSDAIRVQEVNNTMSAAERPYVEGINYWNLGPSGNESLLDTNLNPLPSFQTVTNYFTGLL
jgi:F5/8 type C domain-containing protein